VKRAARGDVGHVDGRIPCCLSIGQNINAPELRVTVRRPSGVCGQDCALSSGPIVTKFGTQLPLNIPKKKLEAVREIGVVSFT